MPLDLVPAYVGSRVVARRALRSGGYSDVLGDLVEWRDGDILVIRTRRGELVEVALATVVAGKQVPPPPPSVAQVLALEEAAAAGWPGLEQHRLGGWLLRAGGGFTGRANSALPIGEPDRDVPAAVEAVAEWYADRGLPARFQVPLRARAALDRDLAEAGFAIDNPSRVLVAPIAALTGAGTPGTVDLAATPDDSWLATYTYRGGTLPDVGPAVLTACDGDVSFATLKDDEGVVAIGRGAACAGWLGLTAVEVAPRARRRGHAVTVCRALGAWAQERGARQVYLQVADGNTAALALYAGLGLRHHHRYHYRVRRDGDQR